MAKEDITCDNCGSIFILSYDESDVGYSASHCPFCGDFFDSKNDELNFNNQIEFYDDNEELDLDDDNTEY